MDQESSSQELIALQPLNDESSILLDDISDIPSPVGTSSVLVLIQMVVVLALAALAIYGVVFLIKRFAKPQEAKDPNLKVLAKVALSTDSYAAVISVGQKAWLVGGSSGAVNLISEITDIEALETMFIDDAKRSAEAESKRFIDFRSLISRMRGQSHYETSGSSGSIPGDMPGNISGDSHAEALRKQRERLKGL